MTGRRMSGTKKKKEMVKESGEEKWEKCNERRINDQTRYMVSKGHWVQTDATISDKDKHTPHTHTTVFTLFHVNPQVNITCS